MWSTFLVLRGYLKYYSPLQLGKYHFLTTRGAPGIFGEDMNFGNQKWEQKIFGTLRGEQKNFTDPIGIKIKSQKIIYIRKM